VSARLTERPFANAGVNVGGVRRTGVGFVAHVEDGGGERFV